MAARMSREPQENARQHGGHRERRASRDCRRVLGERDGPSRDVAPCNRHGRARARDTGRDTHRATSCDAARAHMVVEAASEPLPSDERARRETHTHPRAHYTTTLRPRGHTGTYPTLTRGRRGSRVEASEPLA